jgi:phosphoglycerate dehydrogenase-like enzyme
MPEITRRLFLGAAPAAAAAQTVALPKPAGPIRILVRGSFEPAEIVRLESAAPGAKVELMFASGDEDFRLKLRDAEVVYGSLAGRELDYAPKLKWVQAPSAGVEYLDQTFRGSPVVLTNMARVFAPAISETAMGLLLCLTRRITTVYMPQFARRRMTPVDSPKSTSYFELGGKTMGIAGMGGIGSFIARRAHNGFDMRVIATDPKPMAKPEYVAELHDPTYFEQMAAQVDVLVSAAPHTPQTERMFNEKVFRSMKPTAYFLNMSRGKLMDDMALVRALKEGWIAGAGLDVFPVEPPPPDHPIFDCPNVVMTPHTSAWSPERQVRVIDLFVENIRRYSIGQPLMNVVDKQKGY